MRSQVLVALLVLGCGSKESKDAPKDDPKPSLGDKPSMGGKRKDRAPTGTPRPQKKITVTLDGKPVDLQQALAWKTSEGIRVIGSSVPVGCDEVTGSMRSIHEGEVTFDVNLGSSLQPDGTLKTELKSTYFSGMTSQSGLSEGVTATTGDAAPGSTFTADVDFKTSSAGKDKHDLVVKGTLDALGCEPAKSMDKAEPLPPEMPATIEIAGKKLPVRGAQISSSGDWVHLKLTTGAETCKTWKTGELSVEISWKSKTDAEPFQVSLGGTLLKQSADQTFDKKKLTVKPAPVVPGEIEINGDITVMKYPVKIAGKVTAVDCKK